MRCYGRSFLDVVVRLNNYWQLRDLVMDLYVKVLGEGPPILFVHGSGGSSDTWVKQLPLATRFKLLMIDRRGYGRSPSASYIDYETDAADIADLLGSGAHIVGESYGAVGSLIAAGQRPERVLSLTVVEPPLFGLVRGDPVVDDIVTGLKQVYATKRNATPDEFAAAFNQAIGFEFMPTKLNPKSRRNMESIMKERLPIDAQVPLESLKAAHFPKLVVSGGWLEIFEGVCDKLARGIDAKRVIIRGEGHNVHRTGNPFNQCLERFWSGVEGALHS